jgi:hypothetical protein
MGQSRADYGWPATNLIWFANALPQPGRGPELGHPEDERASWCGRGSGQASDDGRLHRPLWADHRGVADDISRSTSAGWAPVNTGARGRSVDGSTKRYRRAP